MSKEHIRVARTTRVMRHAAELLEQEAQALKECSTVAGHWGDEVDAKAAHDDMVRTARELKLRALPLTMDTDTTIATTTPAERWVLSRWTYGDEIETAGTARFAWHTWVEIAHKLAGAAHYAELVGDVFEAETLRDASDQALARAFVCYQRHGRETRPEEESTT